MNNYDVSNAIKNYMMQYSKSVIVDRAIVSLEDGLKPSQRLELWALYNNNVRYNKKRIKGLTATGEALKYVPHGDTAVFETMARMAQKDTFLYPLIDGKGNMGQHTGRDVHPSAPRYVEMRLTEFAEELFKNIDKDAVDLVDNFDNTRKQPVVLPTTFPSILTFGSSGIAVGFASNIPSFNLKEVCEYTINTIKGVKNDYLIPDFATKGEIIYNEHELQKIAESGDGKVTVRGTYHLEDNILIIDSIPFSTTREAIIEKIIDLVKQGKLKEIKDVRDGTDKNGMSIEIDLKKGFEIEKVMAKLYKLTPLQSNFSCNMNVIYNDKPVKLGARQIIEKWIEFRRETVKRITKHELNKTNEKLDYLYALRKVLLDIDKAIEIIKTSKNDKECIDNLSQGFDIDNKEAEIIANFKLRNLNKSYINGKLKEISQLEKSAHILQKMLFSKEMVDNYIIKDLKRVMEKYNKERQTKVITEDAVIDLPDEKDMAEDYNVKIFITKEGYIKKIPLTSLRGNYTIKLKDNDEIVSEIETTNNNADILVFTDKHNVYKHKAYDLDDSKPSSLGEYLPSLLSLKDEQVLFATVTDDYDGFIVIGFGDGKVAKISLKEGYWTKQNRSKLKNGFVDKTAILFTKIKEDIDILAVTSINKALVFNTSMINPKSSRTTQGTQVVKSKNDSVVTGYYILDKEYDEADYYRVSNSAVGKYLRNGDFSSLNIDTDNK